MAETRPPVYDPPCDTCAKVPEDHPYGHEYDHTYSYTAGAVPEKEWLCRRCGGTPAVHEGNQCPPTPAEADDFPPCGKCGHSPADHVGWARGHLFIRSMHYQTTPPAEVQPPTGAGATAAPETATYVAANGYCTGCIVDHDPKECGYRPGGDDV